MGVDKRKIKVFFTPGEYLARRHDDKQIVVVVDILRATTSICTAIENGVAAIIPVAGLKDAKNYKSKGYIVASERDSNTMDFADMGNSPLHFMDEKIRGKEVVLSTTNGTKAIEAAKDVRQLLIGSFLNLSALTTYLCTQKEHVTVLCSGWKGVYNLEDSLFAGALAEHLLQNGNFALDNDAALSAFTLWNTMSPELAQNMEGTEAAKRLTMKGLKLEVDYCQKIDTASCVPCLKEAKIINIADNVRPETN